MPEDYREEMLSKDGASRRGDAESIGLPKMMQLMTDPIIAMGELL